MLISWNRSAIATPFPRRAEQPLAHDDTAEELKKLLVFSALCSGTECGTVPERFHIQFPVKAIFGDKESTFDSSQIDFRPQAVTDNARVTMLQVLSFSAAVAH
jgi:hypothetical protein